MRNWTKANLSTNRNVKAYAGYNKYFVENKSRFYMYFAFRCKHLPGMAFGPPIPTPPFDLAIL